MSDLTLHDSRVQAPLPALKAAAGLSPAVIGWVQGLLLLVQLGAVAAQEVTAAQVDGDHQTLVAVENLLHLLSRNPPPQNINFRQTTDEVFQNLLCWHSFHSTLIILHCDLYFPKRLLIRRKSKVGWSEHKERLHAVLFDIILLKLELNYTK